MAAMTIYSNAEVYLWCSAFNGLLTQESHVTVSKKSGLNMVFTTHEGLAGASPGAKTVEIAVDNAVPSADFEMMPDGCIFQNEVVEIWIVMAGKTTKHKAFTTDVEYTHSVNDAAKVSMKFTGRFEQFE